MWIPHMLDANIVCITERLSKLSSFSITVYLVNHGGLTFFGKNGV